MLVPTVFYFVITEDLHTIGYEAINGERNVSNELHSGLVITNGDL